MLDDLRDNLAKNKEIYFEITIFPKAKTSAWRDMSPGQPLRADIKGKPENGIANKELLRFLAKEFLVAANKVKLVKGASSKRKLVQISL